RLHLKPYRIARTDARAQTIQLEVALHRVGAIDGRPRPREHAPGASMVAAEERFDRGALSLVGASIDQHERVTVTLVDRARPLHNQGEVETVERRRIEAPSVDVPRPASLAVAIGRERVEVARTAVVAVARDQHGPRELPLRRGRRHGQGGYNHAHATATRATT